jgi:16S rRNA (cytosine1402-N4)-methyltransferase
MTIHKPVLLKETIDQLNFKKGDIVVDATLGGGGHSREALGRIGEGGKLIAIDADKKAAEQFKKEKDERVVVINDNFANLENILKESGIEKVDAIVADLGWSSDQIENPEFGMSFQVEAELDMRYDRNQKLTAKKIVNEYLPKELEKIIEKYGEERFCRNIVKRIVEYRKNHTIETTTQLADIVKNAVPPDHRYGKISPATRTFQALRIEVNDELSNLEKFVPQAIESLSTGGRLAIITFHSLEDRIVKNIFRENARGCICPPDFPQCVCGKVPKIRLVNKKPIVPTPGEVVGNPRARSAKLRVCEKI